MNIFSFRTLLGILSLAFAFSMLSHSSNAALPPLSQEELNNGVVIEGTVQSVKTSDENLNKTVLPAWLGGKEAWIHRNYVISVAIKSVGGPENPSNILPAGTSVTLRGFELISGPTGDAGVTDIDKLHAGTHARFYIYTHNADWYIREPNGLVIKPYK